MPSAEKCIGPVIAVIELEVIAVIGLEAKKPSLVQLLHFIQSFIMGTYARVGMGSS